MYTGVNELEWHVFREPQTGLYGRVCGTQQYGKLWHAHFAADPNGQWFPVDGNLLPADSVEHAIDRVMMKLRDRYIRFREDEP